MKAGKILIDASESGTSQGVSSHGGVGPWNLLINATGDVLVVEYGLPQVDFLDFLEDDEYLPKDDRLRYCPPERIEGAAEDISSDLFALALIVVEMIAGEPLYDAEGEALLKMVEKGEADKALEEFEFSEELEDLLFPALAPYQDQRHKDPSAFVKAAQELLGDVDESPLALLFADAKGAESDVERPLPDDWELELDLAPAGEDEPEADGGDEPEAEGEDEPEAEGEDEPAADGGDQEAIANAVEDAHELSQYAAKCVTRIQEVLDEYGEELSESPSDKAKNSLKDVQKLLEEAQAEAATANKAWESAQEADSTKAADAAADAAQTAADAAKDIRDEALDLIDEALELHDDATAAAKEDALVAALAHKAEEIESECSSLAERVETAKNALDDASEGPIGDALTAVDSAYKKAESFATKAQDIVSQAKDPESDLGECEQDLTEISASFADASAAVDEAISAAEEAQAFVRAEAAAQAEAEAKAKAEAEAAAQAEAEAKAKAEAEAAAQAEAEAKAKAEAEAAAQAEAEAKAKAEAEAAAKAEAEAAAALAAALGERRAVSTARIESLTAKHAEASVQLTAAEPADEATESVKKAYENAVSALASLTETLESASNQNDTIQAAETLEQADAALADLEQLEASANEAVQTLEDALADAVKAHETAMAIAEVSALGKATLEALQATVTTSSELFTTSREALADSPNAAVAKLLEKSKAAIESIQADGAGAAETAAQLELADDLESAKSLEQTLGALQKAIDKQAASLQKHLETANAKHLEALEETQAALAAENAAAQTSLQQASEARDAAATLHQQAQEKATEADSVQAVLAVIADQAQTAQAAYDEAAAALTILEQSEELDARTEAKTKLDESIQTTLTASAEASRAAEALDTALADEQQALAEAAEALASAQATVEEHLASLLAATDRCESIYEQATTDITVTSEAILTASQQAETVIQTLQATRTSAQDSYNQHDGSDSLDALLLLSTELTDSLESIERAERELTDSLSDLQAAIKAEIKRQEQAAEAAAATLAKIKSDAETLLHDATARVESARQLRQEHASLFEASDVAEATEQWTSVLEHLDTVEDAVTTIHAHHDTIQSCEQPDEAEAELALANGLLPALEAAVEAIHTGVAAGLAQLDAAKAKAGELTQQLTQSLDDLRALIAEQSTRRAQLGERASELEHAGDFFTEVDANHTRANQLASALEASLSAASDSVKELEAQLETARSAVQETRNFNASLDESDAAIQGALDDAEAKRAALEEQAIAAAASQAQKALSSLRPALDNARSPLADLDDGHSPAVMQLIATVDTSTAEADSAIEAVENKVITFEQLTTSEAARSSPTISPTNAPLPWNESKPQPKPSTRSFKQRPTKLPRKRREQPRSRRSGPSPTPQPKRLRPWTNSTPPTSIRMSASTNSNPSGMSSETPVVV